MRTSPVVTAPNETFFERMGCPNMARELVEYALRQLIHDPQASQRATRLERDWLLGLVPEPLVPVEYALDALMIPESHHDWFKQSCVENPRGMLQRLSSVFSRRVNGGDAPSTMELMVWGDEFRLPAPTPRVRPAPEAAPAHPELQWEGGSRYHAQPMGSAEEAEEAYRQRARAS